jgi:hypothetical protein
VNNILVPISPGELLDKITILRIKAARIGDAIKLANVRHELAALEHTWRDAVGDRQSLAADEAALTEVNERLWVIEDDIRLCESRQNFGQQFIDLARSVYIENDARAAIKKRINLALGSQLIEEKSYQPYR